MTMSTSVSSNVLDAAGRTRAGSLLKSAQTASTTGTAGQPATIPTLSPQAQAAMSVFQAASGDGKAATATSGKATKDILPTDRALLDQLRDPAYKGTLDAMRKGVPSEQLASFDAALADGTLNIQRAENVPGLNYKKTDIAAKAPTGAKAA